MKALSGFFYSRSHLLLGLIITALFSVYLVYVFMEKGEAFVVPNSSIKSLGTTFNFGTSDVMGFLSIRSTDMIQAYISFNQVWDTLFGVFYGIMYVVWLSVIFRPISDKTSILNLLPFAQVLFDWIENYQLVVLSNQYLATGSIEETHVRIASIASMIKWGCSGLVMMLILGGLVFRCIYAFRDKNKE